VLPSVFVLGPALAARDLDGASSWAAISAAFGIGTVAGNVVALRARVRRPILVAAIALTVASLQAAIIGSGLGTAGIAALMALAGVGVALFFTFWDLSVQEQVPAAAVARVSSYDFAVSVGIMPVGLAAAGPLAHALGLHATLLALSALAVVSALAWLLTPGVREVRRPAFA
jgi:Transmembrane secretion effector